jgi:hypothetical protein
VGVYTDPYSTNAGIGFWEAITSSGHNRGPVPMTLTIGNQDLIVPDV